MAAISIHKIPAANTWDIRHRVMWPDMELNYVKLPNDEKGIHFGLKKNDRLISVVSLFIENQSAQFRKLATEISEQGKGHGTRLLTHLMAYAINQNIERIWCNARVEKASFYEKFGMKITDQRFSRGDIDYVIMERILNVAK